MRTNATLQAEQRQESVDPYVPIEYYTVGRPSDGVGSWVQIDTLNARLRVIEIEHGEEPYGSTATITLHNEDSIFDAYDLTNLWIRIGRGMVCTGGNEVSFPGYYKHMGKGFTSSPVGHQDTYIIHCEGAWNVLERFIATAPHFFNQPYLEPSLDDMTGKEIVDYILELAGLDLGADLGTLDGKITTWKPRFDVPRGENGAATIRRLLALFKCVLICRTDCMHLKFCQDGDAVDYTYKLPTDAAVHSFISGQSRSLNFKPMKVHVQDLAENPTYEGEYADSSWVASMGYHTWVDIYGVVTSNADCVFIAEAEVARAKSNVETGWFFVPVMNCLQEIYDKVTLVDGRGNISGTGRVGGFYGHFRTGNPNAGIGMSYSCEIRLGGLQRTLSADMQGFVEQLGIGIVGGIPGALLLPRSVLPNALRQAMQKYDCTIVPDPDHADYTWQQVKWLEGTVQFADGTDLTIDAGTFDLTALGYADNPVCLYFIQGNSTLQHTDDWTTAVGKDRDIIAIVQRAEDTTVKDKASWDGHTGKVGVLNTRVLLTEILLAAHIRTGELILGGKVTGDLDSVDDGATWGRVLLTHLTDSKIAVIEGTCTINGETAANIEAWAEDPGARVNVKETVITAGKISITDKDMTDLSAASRILDNIEEGATYGRVKQTILAAGWIQVGTGTKDSNLNGFHISDTEIVGQLAGVDQVVMGTDGKIKAGAGDVVLDSGGIHIYGEKLRLYSATLKGKLYAGADYITLSSEASTRLILTSPYRTIIGGNGRTLTFDSNGIVVGSGNKVDFSSASGGFVIPVVAAKANRPASPQEGMIVYVHNDDDMDFYKNGAWHTIHAF